MNTPTMQPTAQHILFACALLCAVLATPAAGQSPSPDKAPALQQPDGPSGSGTKDGNATGQSDLARKAEVMHSSRWRRAIFELSEWLSSQEIYSPKEVSRIKSDFNRRVEKMSSYDVEYLLEDLETKFKVIDSPEAQEARAWVGQYMSAMSDRKRHEVLKDLPDVVNMTAGQLSQEIEKIEQKRSQLQQSQNAFDQGRQTLVDQAQISRQQTAQAAAAAVAQMNSSPSYSPYRSQGGGGAGGKLPFADSKGSGMTLTSGVFGASVSMNIGSF